MLMAVDIRGHLEQMLGQPAHLPEITEAATTWCMPVVRPGMEQEARDSLRRRGIGTWWPNFQRDIRIIDRETGNRLRRTMFVPMLPGTLICAMPKVEGHDRRFWSAIDQVPGIINVLRKFNGDMIFLSDLDVVLLHKIEEGLSRSKPPKSAKHAYKAGDKVRLIEDEFRSLPPAEVTECKRDSVKIEVNLFGAMRLMEVRPYQIEPVDSQAANHDRPSAARSRIAKLPTRR